MINIGNDNVAVKLRDVECVYDNVWITFPIKKGIYFLTIFIAEDSATDYCRTIVFDIDILGKIPVGDFTYLPDGSDSAFILQHKDENNAMFTIYGSHVLQSKDYIAGFKYIPIE